MNRGIKRLGIIASVLWVVIGGLWVRGLAVGDLSHVAKMNYDYCMNSLPEAKPDWSEDLKRCSDKFDAEWHRDVTETDVNIATAIWIIGPLALFWLLAYVLMWLGRWVL